MIYFSTYYIVSKHIIIKALTGSDVVFPQFEESEEMEEVFPQFEESEESEEVSLTYTLWVPYMGSFFDPERFHWGSFFIMALIA